MRPGSNPVKVVLSKDAAYAKLAAIYGLNKEWLDRRPQASVVVSKAPVFDFKVANYNDKYAAYAALIDKLAISSVQQNALNARGLTNLHMVDQSKFKGIGEGVNLSQFLVENPVEADRILAKAKMNGPLSPIEQRKLNLYQRKLKGLTDRLGIQNGRFQNFTDVQNALQNGDFNITAKEVQTNLTNANKVAPEISRQQTKADYRQGLDRVRTRTNIKPTGHINASYLKNQLDANGQAALEGLLKTNPNMSVSEAMAKLKTQGVVTADMKTSMQMVNNAKQEAIKANQQTSRVKKISAAERGPKPFPTPKSQQVTNAAKEVTQGVTQGVENATKGVAESAGKGASTFLKEQGGRAMKFLGRHKVGAAIAAAGTLLGAGALYSHGKSVGRQEERKRNAWMGSALGGLAGAGIGYGVGGGTGAALGGLAGAGLGGYAGYKFSSYGDLQYISDKLSDLSADGNSLFKQYKLGRHASWEKQLGNVYSDWNTLQKEFEATGKLPQAVSDFVGRMEKGNSQVAEWLASQRKAGKTLNLYDVQKLAKNADVFTQRSLSGWAGSVGEGANVNEWLNRAGITDPQQRKAIIKEVEILKSKPPVSAKPVTQEQKPIVQEQKPIVQEQKPIVQEQKPIVQEQKPIVQEQKPIVQEQKPIVQEQKPKVTRRQKIRVKKPSVPTEATTSVVENTGKRVAESGAGNKLMKFLGKHKVGAGLAAAGTLLGASLLYSHGKNVGREEASGPGSFFKFSSYGDLKAIDDKLAVHLMDWHSLKAAGRKAESILGSDAGYEDFVTEENTLPEHRQFFNTKHSNFTLIPSRRWNPGIDLDASTAIPAAAALAGGVGAYALARGLVPGSWKAQAISAALGAGVGGLAGYELSGGKLPWQ